MPKSRYGRLLKPVRSKLVGQDKWTDHRIGTKVEVQRSELNFGEFVLFFGKKYAKVQATELPETVEFDDGKGKDF